MLAGAIGRIVVASLLVTASAPGLRPALAEPLLITDTKAPDLNCLFNQTCKIAVTDSVGVIPITGISGRAGPAVAHLFRHLRHAGGRADRLPVSRRFDASDGQHHQGL